MSRPLLVSAGEIMVETHRGFPGHRSLGGAAANAAAAFIAAGGLSRLACRLAPDDKLELLRHGLESLGLRGGDIVLGGSFNAVYQIDGPCPYSRYGYTRVGGAGGGLSPSDLAPDLCSDADVVLLSGDFLSLNDSCRAVGRRLLEDAPTGALRAFDVNHRRALADEGAIRRLYDELAPGLDVVKMNVREAVMLWGEGPPEALLERARKRHAYALLTEGELGLRLVAPTGALRRDAASVKVFDDTGAGDAALGAALYVLATTRDAEAAADLAVEYGSRCVASLGALGYLLPASSEDSIQR